ncbi:MAG: hypothetical protein ACTSVY_15740 [Candidatus Helarchaeota archaeon]
MKENQILNFLKEKEDVVTLDEITEQTFKEYSKIFEKYLDGTFFRDSLLIAEAAELIVNHNYLLELEELEKVKRIEIGKKEYWKLRN